MTRKQEIEIADLNLRAATVGGLLIIASFLAFIAFKLAGN